MNHLQKQAKYDNIGAKYHSLLPIGQTSEWTIDQSVKNVRSLKTTFRSCDVQLDSGVVRRRTLRYMRWFGEPPIILNEGEVKADAEGPTSTETTTTTKTASPSGGKLLAVHRQQPQHRHHTALGHQAAWPPSAHLLLRAFRS